MLPGHPLWCLLGCWECSHHVVGKKINKSNFASIMTGLHISDIRYILKRLIVKLKRIVVQSTRRGLGLLSHPLTSDSGKEALQWLSGLQCSFCNQCKFQKQTSFVRRIIFRPKCLWSYEITSCFATSLFINIVYCKGSQRNSTIVQFFIYDLFHLLWLRIRKLHP